MPPAPLPPDETARLRCLSAYGLGSTSQSCAFNNLAAEAARRLRTPIAAVCVVARDRQWFKARVGLTMRETPRDYAFCGYAILGDDLLVVTDTAEDPRFADNPLVQGEPRIRFYAGAPLRVSSGAALGTLCVMDRRPRQLDGDARNTLRALARQVVTRFEINKVLAEFVI